MTSTTPAFRLIGGKGGVGKTTCAAAVAVHAARSGLRTLVISTDPAPSLADAFALGAPKPGRRRPGPPTPGRRLGPGPRRIPLGRHSLHAVEIDADRALDRWLAARRDALERIAARGTWLDDEDVARLLRLSLPGIDEIAALLEIVRFGQTGRFDLIVVDTAPTGHTLRMLAMPGLLRRVAAVFDDMQGRHRLLVGTLRGRWEPDAEDALIEELDEAGRALGALFQDADRARTSWVTLPEPASVEETRDGIAALTAAGIAVRDVIVNRLTGPPPRACTRCEAHRRFEARTVRALARVLRAAPPGPAMVGLAACPREPRGVAALGAIGREIAAERPPALAAAGPVRAWRATPAAGAAAEIGSLADPATRLLMFGGKGGVGKSTCAAAVAISIARHDPRRRVLLLSTDPAHSLGDILNRRVSDTAGPVAGAPSNVAVRELDAAARFATIRDRYAAAVHALFDRLSGGSSVDASQDRRVVADLIDLAPPGIDELVAIVEVTEAIAGPAAPYDLVVMDMAPSGHALRLLETPGLVHDWAKALMAILLKYQALVGVGELGALLVALSQGLGRLRALLADPARARVVVVTRAAALPSAETARLLSRLRRLRIGVAAVVVNALGRGTCPRCRAEARAESRQLAALRGMRAVRGLPVFAAPAEVPPPQGPAALARWWRQVVIP